MKNPAVKKASGAKRGPNKSTRAKGANHLGSLNLEAHSSKELKELRDQIEQTLVSQKETYLRDAYVKMQEIADDYDTTVEEVVKHNRGGTKKRKAKGAKKTVGDPQFRNPENHEQTWTGRGKRPGWFVNAVNSGVDPDSMRIK